MPKPENGGWGQLWPVCRSILQSLRLLSLDAPPPQQHCTCLPLSAGANLHQKFHRTHDMKDLNQGIVHLTQELERSLLDDLSRAQRLDDLACLFWSKYKKLGDISDLHQSIIRGEESIKIGVLDPQNRALYLMKLAACLVARCENTKNIEDLNQGITYAEEATGLLVNPHFTCDLIHYFQLRFQMTDDISNLDRAIQKGEAVASTFHSDRSKRAVILGELANTLITKYETRDAMSHLESAIKFGQEAVTLVTPKEPGWIEYLNLLVRALSLRYEKIEDVQDIDQIIEYEKEMVAICPQNYPHRLGIMSNLASSLSLRYERIGKVEDLNQSIEIEEELLELTPNNDPKHTSFLNNLGVSLWLRYKKTSVQRDIERAISYGEEVLLATIEDDPNRANYLTNLANWLGLIYQKAGNQHQLDRAIELSGKAVDKISVDNPERAMHLHNLSGLFITRYSFLGAMCDLMQAITLSEESISRTLADDPSRPTYVGELGYLLRMKFGHTKDSKDLEKAIEFGDDALATIPKNHPKRASLLSHLAYSFHFRFMEGKDIDDLERAVDLAEQAVAAASNISGRIGCLRILGVSLSSKYESSLGDISGLDRAIEMFEEVMRELPPDHPYRYLTLFNLGGLLGWRYGKTKKTDDLENAIIYLRQTAQSPLVSPSQRANSALKAMSILYDLEIGTKRWKDISEFAETVVNLLPLISSRSLGQHDQQHRLEQYAGVPCFAAAACLQAGKPADYALNVLERGRGCIANFKFESRSDLDSLRKTYPEMAAKFQELCEILDSTLDPMSADTEVLATQMVSRRHSSRQELDILIETIQKLPEFEKFPFPSSERGLKEVLKISLWRCVIVINVSFRCDAFLVQQSGVTVLPLNDLNDNDLKQMAQSLMQKKLGKEGMLKLLKWLWDVISLPILSELGCQIINTTNQTSFNWPRICWIPTGLLCLLPIHASGPYMGGSLDSVLDRVVSSYSTSINSLLYSYRNKGRKDRTYWDNASRKFLLVSMEKTPGLKQDGYLPFVKDEILNVGDLISDAPIKARVITLEDPQREDVLNELSDCTVFHFAGHGELHSRNPLQSSLLLTDWNKKRLTVEDLTAKKLFQTPPLLAYLSACSTGTTEVLRLLDEGIHLMSSCQLAGFQHVVGSLWELSDSHCVSVARDLYDNMLKNEMSDESISYGLHKAVRALRGGTVKSNEALVSERHAKVISKKEVEREIGDPFVWAAYIHMGV